MSGYRLYLDACCLNRPFDDQAQLRIALETQAILSTLDQCLAGAWQLITSDALEAELQQMPDKKRLKDVTTMLVIAKIRVISSQFVEQRTGELQQLGFTAYDASHIASAERGKADILLTTDDRLVRRAKSNQAIIQVPVDNPTQWLMSITQENTDA